MEQETDHINSKATKQQSNCNMTNQVPETFGSSISLFEYEMGFDREEEWPTPFEMMERYSIDRRRSRERRQRYREWGKGGLRQ